MPLCNSRLPGSLNTSFRNYLITPIVVKTIIITITIISITMTGITTISTTSKPSTPPSVPSATLCPGVKLLEQHFLPGKRPAKRHQLPPLFRETVSKKQGAFPDTPNPQPPRRHFPTHPQGLELQGSLPPNPSHFGEFIFQKLLIVSIPEQPSQLNE